MLNKIIIIFFLIPLKLFSQDISGVWTGTIYVDTTKKYLPYEIVINEKKGKLTGYSHTLFVVDNKNETGIKSIKIKSKGEKFLIEDDDLIYNDYTVAPPKGVKQYSALTLYVTDSAMILKGTFNTNRTREYIPLTGTIQLQKKINYEKTKIVAKLKELDIYSSLSFIQPDIKKDIAVKTPKKEIPAVINKKEVVIISNPVIENQTSTVVKVVQEKPLPPKPKELVKKPDPKPEKKEIIISEKPTAIKPAAIQPENKVVAKNIIPLKKTDTVNSKISSSAIVSTADLQKRKIENIKTVFFKSDSLTITLYDNGEIDGDIVSVIMNGKNIMPSQKLSATAITKTIYTSEIGDSIQLILYAENLGSIPPNTGLLILKDGEDRYEIRFAGDLQKNSAITLRRKVNNH